MMDSQFLVHLEQPAVSPTSSNSITQLLAAVSRGDESASEKLWGTIYDELHGLAQRQMANEAPGGTLQPTSLVHEAYLRLFGSENVDWKNRRHFFAAAAQAMRQIRIDDARKRKRLKRGGGQKPEILQDGPPVFDPDPTEVLMVDEALRKLADTDPRKAELVALRYFAGLTMDEVAHAMGLPARTVDREWSYARAWLHREFSKGDSSQALEG